MLNDASPEAVEMKPVLEKLVSEYAAKSYFTKVNELPAFQAVRTQSAAYQGRLALALATAMSTAPTVTDASATKPPWPSY